MGRVLREYPCRCRNGSAGRAGSVYLSGKGFDMSTTPRTPVEYRFKIDAFTPESIPLARLSQYLGDLARMMGESANVHLLRVDSGSTIPVISVDYESAPKVQDRLRLVKFGEGPAEPRNAYKVINKRLVEDNANGVLIDPGAVRILQFPGRDGANQAEFGPITQNDVFQGIPIMIGGEQDVVPIHLEDGEIKHILKAPRRIAKQIAPYLFTSVVRIEGKGRWLRNRMGEWEMQSFYAQDFQVLPDADLRGSLLKLQAIPSDWKSLDDPLRELAAMRTGVRPQ